MEQINKIDRAIFIIRHGERADYRLDLKIQIEK
jgi:hypothetical protein